MLDKIYKNRKNIVAGVFLFSCITIMVDTLWIEGAYSTRFQWVVSMSAGAIMWFVNFCIIGPEQRWQKELERYNPKTQEILILEDGSRHIVEKLDNSKVSKL